LPYGEMLYGGVVGQGFSPAKATLKGCPTIYAIVTNRRAGL